MKEDADLAKAEGRTVPELGEGGRLYTDSGLQEWKSAKTGLGYGDFIRSKEIAEFFHENKLKLPDEESSLWSGDVDYEDVKLKIIQQEGLDMHDFNIFDDRASLLWRKPWTDGMARELTSGDRFYVAVDCCSASESPGSCSSNLVPACRREFCHHRDPLPFRRTRVL